MSTEAFNKQEAKNKLKELVEDIKVAMMVTDLGKKPLSAIPMTSKKVDEEGNIWFLSLKNSEHNQNIALNQEIQLLYSDPSNMEFLSVFGTGEISADQEILEDLYVKTDNNWFNGPEDPNLTAIKFRPKEAFFWDTKKNKYITLYKLGIAALTGNEKDIGEKGKLEL